LLFSGKQDAGGSAKGDEEEEGDGYMLVDPRLQQCVDCCSQLSTVRYKAFSLFCNVGSKMQKVQRRERRRRVMGTC
jgi:hypothetical protein